MDPGGRELKRLPPTPLESLCVYASGLGDSNVRVQEAVSVMVVPKLVENLQAVERAAPPIV